MRVSHLFLLLGITLAPSIVQADRYHARTGGLRLLGPSVPDVWDQSNCYPSLQSALQQATPADSLVLYAEDHVVTSQLQLLSHLANHSFSGDYSTCRVLMESDAEFHLDQSLSAVSLRGVSFVGSGPSSQAPVLFVENTNENLQELLIEDCAFTDHEGSTFPYGGSCIHARNNGHGLQLILRRSVFCDNSTTGPGGAVFLEDNYHLLAEDCEFANNESLSNLAQIGRGGAICVCSRTIASSLELVRCRVDENRTAGPGGGLSVEDAQMTMVQCDITENRSTFSGASAWAAGAGLFMIRTGGSHLGVVQLHVSQSRFTGNAGNLAQGSFAGDGGGVLVKGADVDRMVTASLSEVLFQDNFNAQGAGLYVGRYATGSVCRCTFRNNTAYACGGATYKGGAFDDNIGETARYEYCEFIENQAGYDHNGYPVGGQGSGGAFKTRLNPRGEFINCSFSNNRSGGGSAVGDAIAHSAEGSAFTDIRQQCVLVNCVFFGMNGLDTQVSSDAFGFSEVSHCAHEEGEFDCPGTTPVATVALTECPFCSVDDPYLKLGSPCIDQGVDVGITSDIVGTVVPQAWGPDIGAYEFIPVTSSRAPGETGPLGGHARILPPWPNPFSARTTFAFELGRSDQVRLRLVDSAGRVIVSIADDVFAPGLHRVGWRGVASGGHRVAAGVYYVCLESSDGIQSRKFVVIR